jgi:hypothetical protein
MLKIKNYNSSEVETELNTPTIKGFLKIIFDNRFKPEHAANPTLIDYIVAETVFLRQVIDEFSCIGQKALDYNKDDLYNLEYFQTFLRNCTIDLTTRYRFERIVYPKDIYSQEDYRLTRGRRVSLHLQTYYQYTDDSDFDLITEENLHFLQTNPPYMWFGKQNALKCLKAIMQAYCWCCK